MLVTSDQATAGYRYIADTPSKSRSLMLSIWGRYDEVKAPKYRFHFCRTSKIVESSADAKRR